MFANLMERSSRRLLWLYILLCGGAFLTCAVITVKGGRDALKPYLLPGKGLIESAPTPILGLGFILSSSIAWRLHRAKRAHALWLLFSAFTFLLFAEETGWGRESMFGFEVRERPAGGSTDFHDTAAKVARTMIVELEALPVVIGLIVAGGIVFVAVRQVTQQRNVTVTRVVTAALKNQCSMFILIGIFFYALAESVDFLDGIGVPNLPGQWFVEEFSEAVGSAAFLFSALAKLLAPPCYAQPRIDSLSVGGRP